MRLMAQFALAAVMLMSGTTLATAQNGPAVGAYLLAGENQNFIGSRSNFIGSRSNYDYYDYDGRPRYERAFGGRPQYRLGSPVPSYGYWRWRDW